MKGSIILLLTLLFLMPSVQAQTSRLSKDYDPQALAGIISDLQRRINGLEQEQSPIIVSASQPRGAQGRLWYRPQKQELWAYLGNEWRFIYMLGDTVDVAGIPPAIPVTKIETGQISPLEWGFLDGITDTIQTQINMKFDSTIVKPRIAAKADTADVAYLGQDETITGNWVNNINKWEDNEVEDDITIDLATTATALAANGANAGAGNAILGVDASGAAEGAFDVWTEAENDAAGYLAMADTNYTDSTDVAGFGYETGYRIALQGSYHNAFNFTGGAQTFKWLFQGAINPGATEGWVMHDDAVLTDISWMAKVTAAGTPGDIRFRVVADGSPVVDETVSITGVSTHEFIHPDLNVSIAAGVSVIVQILGTDFTGTIDDTHGYLVLKFEN